ncbi:MAG TPA: hypothetical protein VMS95_02380, partial [Candidatus Krumholzibacteriaceae bacterium]|nr:hypothetical protein [Candidatus Krumholzibacteriaceae bacterium]
MHLVVALLVSGVILKHFPIFNKINQTIFIFYYGYFKSLRTFWHRQSTVCITGMTEYSLLCLAQQST